MGRISCEGGRIGSSGFVGGGVGLWKSGLGSVWAIDPAAVRFITNRVPIELTDNNANELSYKIDENMIDSY